VINPESTHSSFDESASGIDPARLQTTAVPQIKRKTALVIGLNRYDDKHIPQLINAVPDAQAVGDVLARQMGYDVVRLIDPTKAEVLQTLNSLVAQTTKNDSLVIYFAGHGELVEKTGLGYWIPRDASASDPRGWISNADVNRILTVAKSKQIALLSDSCYSGAFAKGTALDKQQTSNKLESYLELKAVTAMSSGGDEPVADSGKNGHSVFAWTLMERIRQLTDWTPGNSLYDELRIAVERELPQTPMYGALSSAGHEAGADFLFERRAATAPQR
jgi:uncharacterized caspase-like protein